jgi:hypothetical protein
LEWAIIYDLPDLVKLLLVDQADPNALPSTPQKLMETPLVLAVNQGKRHGAEIGQLLLEHGAKPNLLDSKTGWTALDGAVEHEAIELVRVLAEHGADVNALDKNGLPPLAHLHLGGNMETANQIEDLLIKAGADANYNRRHAIWTCDPAGTPKMEVFQCPTNSINHYTLLDFLATLYQANSEQLPGIGWQATHAHPNDLVPFPDFARVAIHRLDGKRDKVLHVNVSDILQSGNGSKDVALQAGDLIEIPEQEHKVADQWFALSQANVTALNKCLVRSVRLVAQGRTNVIALAPSLGIAQQTAYMPTRMTLRPDLGTNWLAEALLGRKPDTIVRSFDLDTVVRDSNVRLNTWDLTRVRLKRGGAKMTFDLTAKPAPEVWLEDRDVIEIPELGEGGPR